MDISKIKISKATATSQKRDFPDEPFGQGGPPCTLPNVQHLGTMISATVRYDVIKKKTLIVIPGLEGTPDNRDNTAITFFQSEAAKHGMPTGSVPAMLDAVADLHPYNSVADWIGTKEWDGEDRKEAICNTLQTTDEFPLALKIVLIWKWLLSAVAAVLLPSGFRARGVLTLQGPQGLGKTSWCRSLVDHASLRDQVIKLDHHLDAGNKDSMIGAITHWIVEIGELDSSFKRDVSRLKGFLTNDTDKVRRPYAKVDSEYPRRTVFMATVNQHDFLVDATGNSRWWTLPVVAINHNHGIDMQQVFAQLACEMKAGAIWWLTADEEAMLAAQNDKHRTYSLVVEKLFEVVDFEGVPAEQGTIALTASEILQKAGFDRPTNAQAKECAAYLRERLGAPRRIQGRDKYRVVLRPKPLDTDMDGPDEEEPEDDEGHTVRHAAIERPMKPKPKFG
jgi:putative DNA primase/helicase